MPMASNADDQRVQARIGHERHLDLLVQHEGDQSDEDDEHQHPEQEDAGRRQLEWIEFFGHELSRVTPNAALAEHYGTDR